MTPTTTGIHRLQLPDGRVVSRRVADINGQLYVIGWLVAWPVEMVAGTWIE
jgi:hypothetical protein